MAVKEFDSTADTRMSLERSPLASPEAEPPPARLDEEAPEIALAFSETVLTTRSLEEADELDPEKVASLRISTLIEDACANGAGTESEHSASSSDTPGTPTLTAEDAEIYGGAIREKVPRDAADAVAGLLDAEGRAESRAGGGAGAVFAGASQTARSVSYAGRGRGNGCIAGQF